MSRKIGIITFHSAHNYGAMLQAYALQKKIENMGQEVNIIDYRTSKIDNQYKVFNIKSKNPIKVIKKIITSIRFYKLNSKRFKTFEKFMNENMKLSKRISKIKDLDKYKFDAYITGSDQVWNPNIVGELSDVYTLNFGDNNLKRISYAASIGNGFIEEKYKSDYKEKISNINYVSVREEDARRCLKEIINKNIEVVLDPTLLLTKSEWNKEIENYNREREKYILAYVVQENEEYLKIVNDLSKKTGLKVIHFSMKNHGYKNILKSAYTEGPLEFVNYIKNAEYVVATSFHATVFSIIFNKKFFIVPHKQTGARVTNLLDKLGIKGRTFNTYEEFKDVDYTFETDWENVNKKLEEERQKSMNWLNNAINSEKE